MKLLCTVLHNVSRENGIKKKQPNINSTVGHEFIKKMLQDFFYPINFWDFTKMSLGITPLQETPLSLFFISFSL